MFLISARYHYKCCLGEPYDFGLLVKKLLFVRYITARDVLLQLSDLAKLYISKTLRKVKEILT